MRPHLIRLLSLVPLLLALSACQRTDETVWSGYAEGERLYLAAPVAGRIATLAVQSGEAVQAQQTLFTLEGTLERGSESEASARARSAQAQAADTDKGRRREEIAVSEARLSQARSAAELAHAELARRQQLVRQGFVARAQVADAELLARQADARVSELQADLKTARLPAREDTRASARALADAAQSEHALAGWRLRETTQQAPTAGRIVEVFFRPGEWVGAGQPVLALLPPANRKARFFVPQAELGSLALEQPVRLSCDGCGQAIAARISYIAPQAEYTPPVIYSNEQRAKLVFLVEARPLDPADAERLHPGQPLDVRPEPGAPRP